MDDANSILGPHDYCPSTQSMPIHDYDADIDDEDEDLIILDRPGALRIDTGLSRGHTPLYDESSSNSSSRFNSPMATNDLSLHRSPALYHPQYRTPDSRTLRRSASFNRNIERGLQHQIPSTRPITYQYGSGSPVSSSSEAPQINMQYVEELEDRVRELEMQAGRVPELEEHAKRLENVNAQLK